MNKKFLNHIIIFNLFMIMIICSLFFLSNLETILNLNKKNLIIKSKIIEKNLYIKMLNGKSLKNTLNKITLINKDKNYKLFLNKKIDKNFNYKNKDFLINKIFKENNIIINHNFLTYIYYIPIKVKKDYLKFYPSLKINDNLAILKVIDYNILKDITINFKYYLILTILFLLFIYFFISYEIKKRTIKTILEITNNIHNVHNYNDLKNLSFLNNSLFNKYNKELYLFLSEYQKKLKLYSFDKKLINFQTDLLNKFLITSPVKENWINYIKGVIDNDKYEILIIWKNIPSSNLKINIENEIKSKIISSKAIFIFDHEIINNIKFENENLILSNSISKENLYKNNSHIQGLKLNKPSIGDFIGIGFDNSKSNKNDKLKYIMLEKVLNVLINLIGSAKIISKYIHNINDLAIKDNLTDLYNRRIFHEMAITKMNEIKRRKEKDFFSLIFLDIDNFKLINDNFGHKAGDIFLKQMANILKNNSRKEDIIARYGGDEFVMILDKNNIGKSIEVILRIQNDLSLLKKDNKNQLPKEIGLSAGIVEYPKHSKDLKELIAISDEMMYSGKKDGKNKIITCDNDFILNYMKQNKLKKEIVKKSIEKSLIIPYFQKIKNLNNEKDDIYKLLMRIELDNKILNAKEFIKIAEDTNLINN